MLNSLGFLNDGLFEVDYLPNFIQQYSYLKFFPLMRRFFDGITKEGGTHVYHPMFSTYRCKEAKIYNKNYDNNGSKVAQRVAIDGEDHWFIEEI